MSAFEKAKKSLQEEAVTKIVWIGISFARCKIDAVFNTTWSEDHDWEIMRKCCQDVVNVIKNYLNDLSYNPAFFQLNKLVQDFLQLEKAGHFHNPVHFLKYFKQTSSVWETAFISNGKDHPLV